MAARIVSSTSPPGVSVSIQGIHGVAGEAGYGLDKDLIDLARPAVVDHAQEVRALLRLGSGNARILIYLDHRPFGVRLDQVGVVLYLSLKAIFLFFLLSGYAGVGRDLCFLDLRGVVDLHDRDLRHGAYYSS